MRPRLRPIVPLVAVLVLLAPGPATAMPVKGLWATVNRCDTAGSPNTIGIRARAPRRSARHRVYMRFEAQFYSPQTKAFVPTGSSSRWIRVGRARRAIQSGYSFQFADPPEGQEFLMRGIVQFRYTARRLRRGKRRWVVVRTYERRTRSGYANVQDGDPPGSSFALCVIRRGIGEGRS